MKWARANPVTVSCETKISSREQNIFRVQGMGVLPVDVNSRITWLFIYRQVCNISRNLVGTEIVDHPDVVGA